MKTKKTWIAIALMTMILACLFGMYINYRADVYGYFRSNENLLNAKQNNVQWQRYIKPNYIKKNPKQYTGLIIGGSKAGGIDTNGLNQLTGLKFYNSYFMGGCFEDYLAYTSYYLDTMPDLQEIILHISCVELKSYTASDEKGYSVYSRPSFITNKSNLEERFHCLMVDLNTSIKSLVYEENNDEDAIDGTRTLRGYYENYINIADSFVDEGKDAIETLCLSDVRKTEAADDNVAALKQIKKLCEDKGVRLTVVIGASPITEKADYEGEAFYNYLRDIVNVVDVYDFSGFYDVNRNICNFCDIKHYYHEVADEMFKRVYGQKEFEDFGCYLSKNNIEDYILSRRKEYNRIKEKYKKSGKIDFLGKNDKSNLLSKMYE